MTQSGFTASPEDMRGAAPGYAGVADQLALVYTQLAYALDLEGACWGNDEVGQVFGQKYAPSAVSLLRAMSGTSEGIQSMVDGICSWASNYMDADQAARADAAQIDPGGG